MPKIAIFGGTFDPVHWGHLLLAEAALDQFQLDRIIWVPTCRPSYKEHPLLAFEQRMAMVQRAIADHPAFTVSAIEAQQAGTSYAIETFKALRRLEPPAQWYWIVGNDAFQSLPKWYGSQTLIAQCIWLVAPRRLEGKEETLIAPLPSALSTSTVRWHPLSMPSVELSSGLIRQRCRDGRSIRYWVPETVHSYITEQNLYQMG